MFYKKKNGNNYLPGNVPADVHLKLDSQAEFVLSGVVVHAFPTQYGLFASISVHGVVYAGSLLAKPAHTINVLQSGAHIGPTACCEGHFTGAGATASVATAVAVKLLRNDRSGIGIGSAYKGK